MTQLIDYKAFKTDIANSKVAAWHEFFVSKVVARLSEYTHGELDSWENLLTNLPEIETENNQIKNGIQINSKSRVTKSEQNLLREKLMLLHPWRKGPFSLLGLNINTEWRSDWKWERLIPHIEPLENRTVLDVGCGNGYHCLRAVGEGARFVLGIDPSQKYLAQFAAVQKYLNCPQVHLLPLGIEDLPLDMQKNRFDSVFCMGVFYHQRNPIGLLNHLKGLLRADGELILETLVIDGDENQVLLPNGRYAQMRNVWFLPSVEALTRWLCKCGFKQVKCVDINQTRTAEQRTTDWMTFHSLKDYLSPDDLNKTVEGYPAPKRAVLVAKGP